MSNNFARILMPGYSGTILLLGIVLMLGACKSNQLAFEQTEIIKKNGLVFRLPDYQSRIRYLEKQGSAEQVKAEKSKIELSNRELVQHFQKEFTFCPVRFFYASQSSDLLDRKQVLLNSELQPDPTVPLPERVILAYFAPGEIVDNQFEGLAFRIVGTTSYVRPTYITWLTNRAMQPADVRKFNRILYTNNNSKPPVTK